MASPSRTRNHGAAKLLPLLTALVLATMMKFSFQKSDSSFPSFVWPFSSFSPSFFSSSSSSSSSSSLAVLEHASHLQHAGRRTTAINTVHSTNHHHRRRLHYGKCKLAAPQLAQHKVSTTFVASYPGSGSATLQSLTEALTGLQGQNEYRGHAKENWVVLDTHYPCYHGRRVEGFETVQRSILLLRNPLNAMPDYYRYLCSIDASLQQAAEASAQTAWFVWRDASFEGQIQVWRKHAEYWMDEFDADRKFVTSYERLLEPNGRHHHHHHHHNSDDQGAYEALRLSTFLSKSQGVTTQPKNQIPCLWQKVVGTSASSSASRLAVGVGVERQRQLQQQASPHGGNFVPSYQPQQLKDTMLVLSQLLERYRDERSMAPILVDYLDNIGLRGPHED